MSINELVSTAIKMNYTIFVLQDLYPELCKNSHIQKLVELAKKFDTQFEATREGGL
jgi:hypothetical protein